MHHINLTIERGQSVALIGPVGAGTPMGAPPAHGAGCAHPDAKWWLILFYFGNGVAIPKQLDPLNS